MILIPFAFWVIEIRNIWKFQIACLKSRDFSSSSVTVRYIPITSCRVKIPHLEYCSFADGSGVSQSDVEKAVEVVFKDKNDGAEEEKSIINLSKKSMDHLYVQASKQWFKGENVSKETRKSRIIRWLRYRGFDWNVISTIVNKLDRQEHNPP
ncbi:hypothetical protein KIW84_020127 [Lathyrus oleraceus]|uniref:Regulatory protein RecX n=1 Tax=Pisum sativum TaxID=3888 RepID=A0A9D4Y5I7_PEA|nr:hypothetical protein KIW84_020127 [Pisum sativum]